MNNKWIDLEGKTVVVTGGAMGIGEAIAADLNFKALSLPVFIEVDKADSTKLNLDSSAQVSSKQTKH